MSDSRTWQDPGIQVVAGDIDPEVDSRGIQHQPYDREAPLESREAHFQANFQRDEEAHHHAGYPRQQSVTDGRIGASIWSRLRTSSKVERSWPKASVWLRFALVVISCLTITTTVLAALYAHRRFAQ